MIVEIRELSHEFPEDGCEIIVTILLSQCLCLYVISCIERKYAHCPFDLIISILRKNIFQKSYHFTLL